MLDLSPSLMCSNPGYLARELVELENAGATSFHVDIMDGIFVPNFALSWDQVSFCRKHTQLPVEAHLMVEHIDTHLKFALKSGVRTIYFHYENKECAYALKEIKKEGIEAGLAINPETEISEFEDLLQNVEKVLMMRVKPGFAGQKPLIWNDAKIFELKKKYPKHKVSVDGAVSVKTISEFSKYGIEGFVLGTSAIFGKERSYKDILNALKHI